MHQEANDLKVNDNVQVPSKFRVKSEMMLEMEKIEPEIFQIGKPQEEETEEEPKLTREELIQRSRELRQLRIKESQRSIKAHHQNKIKSKKFHRILKKEKMRQQIKEFELLQKTDPEAALRKIEQLDRSRIEERGLLRHRNTGTWAKNLAVRAKYDKDARKDLAEQIAISRELTAKKNIDESDDEGEEPTTDVAGDDEDPFNPWLKAAKANGTGTNEIGEFMSGYRKYWQERNEKEKELADYKAKDEPENDENEETLGVNDSSEMGENNEKAKITSKKRKSDKLKTKLGKKSKVNAGWIEEDMSEEVLKPISKKTKKKLEKVKEKKSQIFDTIDDLFDDAEEALREKGRKVYEKVKSSLATKKSNKNNRATEIDGEAEENDSEQMDLRFKKQNQRAQEDVALNGDDNDTENLLSKRIANALNSIKSNGTQATNNDSENINPDDIAKVKPQHLTTALPDTVYSVADDGYNEYDDDYHFDEEKKMTIAEAFEDDDIVAEFKREKDEQAKKNGPQEIDLSMPGWGSWGGTGIDPTKQKTKRKLVLRKFFFFFGILFSFYINI